MKITPAQFASILTHEMRVPLQGAMSCASQVQHLVSQGKAPDQALQDLRDFLERMHMVNEQARWYARTDDDSRILRGLTSGGSFRGILEGVAAIFQRQSKRKNLEVLIKRYDLPMHVAFPLEPDLLHLIAFNLINNAVQYSFRGTQVVIVCLMEKNCCGAVLRVIDKGLRLTEEEMGRCGEAFWRAPQATSTHVGGAGLGLFIVCQILKSVGGRFRIRAQGEVTIAEVHIPFQRDR